MSGGVCTALAEPGRSPEGSDCAAPLWRPAEGLASVRELLGRGGILGIPTESSYGLAVDPTDPAAVASLYEVKSREQRKPLALVVADRDQAADLGLDVDSDPFRWAERHWPAPLTVLVPYRPGVLALGELDLVGVRVPDHPPLLELLEGVGHGLTATSANLSGEPGLLRALDVAGLLTGRDALVVDGPPLPGGEPSTVVAWRGADDGLLVLRRGRFRVAGNGGTSA